jgi:hypothetical protein
MVSRKVGILAGYLCPNPSGASGFEAVIAGVRRFIDISSLVNNSGVLNSPLRTGITCRMRAAPMHRDDWFGPS